MNRRNEYEPPFTGHPARAVATVPTEMYLNGIKLIFFFATHALPDTSYSYSKRKLDALISQIYFWNKILHKPYCFTVHFVESL